MYVIDTYMGIILAGGYWSLDMSDILWVGMFDSDYCINFVRHMHPNSNR